MNAFDAIVEIFMWVGLGAGLLIGLIALVMRLADGTWVPTQVLIEDAPPSRIARWFGQDGVGEARLTPEQEKALVGRGSADVFTREGASDRIRLTKASPAVRAVALLALGLLALGTIAAVVSIVLLFLQT